MAMGCKQEVNMIYNTGYRLSVNNFAVLIEYVLGRSL